MYNKGNKSVFHFMIPYINPKNKNLLKKINEEFLIDIVTSEKFI